MNNFVKNSLIFAVGAAVGSVVTWRLLKPVYEQRTQIAIDEVKETYSQTEYPPVDGDTVEETEKETPAPKQEKPKNSIYENMVSNLGYTRYDKPNHGDESEEEPKTMDRPYVISPEEYGELDDYDCYEYTYYKDKVLADELDHRIPDEEVEEKIGLDSLTRFGEYEPDSVYVRNDATKSDYAILLDLKTYAEVLEEKPYLKED